MERKWREHVECVLRKDICMRRSKAVISTKYPRLYIHSIRNSHRHATGLMDSHQSMQTMPRCLDANGLAFGAGTQPTLQNALPLPLSVTPSSSNTDNRHRCETKKEEENEDWKTGSSISGKKNNINTKNIQEKTQKEIPQQQQQRKTLKY